MNEEFSYIFYTFFENLQEMKEKPPWCLFEIYHMYDVAKSDQENRELKSLWKGLNWKNNKLFYPRKNKYRILWYVGVP